MANFELNYTGQEVNELLAKADTAIQQSELEAHHDSTKQDVINDLATIRTNAGKGATAVQPSALLEKSVEEWSFLLADGSTVTKKVVLGA